MSNANVRFHAVDGDDYDAAPGREQSFSFDCPKHKRRCGDLIIRGRTRLKQDPELLRLLAAGGHRLFEERFSIRAMTADLVNVVEPLVEATRAHSLPR